MKTLQLITLSLVLLITATTLGQAKENDMAKKKAEIKLNADIKELFEDMPFDEIMCDKDECKLSICFKVNENGNIEIYHILGKNSKLVDYSKQLLAENTDLKADRMIFANEYYWINVKFKYNR